LAALREHRERVTVEVNAYPGNSNLSLLFETFDSRGIEFKLRPESGQWFDLRDTSFRGGALDKLRNIKNVCAFYKRNYDQWMLTDGRLSTLCCITDYLRHYLHLHDKLTDDYIDLRQTPDESLVPAMERLYERGYFDACNYCASGFQDNPRRLKAAVQLKKRNGHAIQTAL
jgi:hypothetical protein